MAEDIILKALPADLANLINEQQVIRLIQAKHDYPFLTQIISGPIDIDKLDYLLRDAYHVGLKYSFDLDYFVTSYTILGDQECLTKCKLGIEDNTKSRVTTELFVVIWKSMYDLVYHVEDSRIAEKMLEKAILINQKRPEIIDKFTDMRNYLDLDDDKLLNLLISMGGKSAELVNSIKAGNVFEVLFEDELNQEKFEMSDQFVEALKNPHKVNVISDSLSKQFNERCGQSDYAYIVDIISSRAPSEIQMNIQDEETGEYADLRKKSPIVGAIQSKNVIKIYTGKSNKTRIDKQKINTTLKEVVEGF